MIPTGMRYTSTVKGSEWKTVSCEHCPKDYAYKVTREATGTGRSVLFLDNDGAKERAQQDVEASIARTLNDAIEAVWCPGCGNYQTNMLRIVKFDRVLLLYVLAVVIAIVGVIVCALWGSRSFMENVIGVPGLIFWGLSGFIAVGAAFRSAGINPNSDARSRAGTVLTRVPVMLRDEYELAVAKAVSEGRPKHEFLVLKWARSAIPSRSTPARSHSNATPSSPG